MSSIAILLGNWRLMFIILLGVFLRYSFRFSSYSAEISKRVEVSSPVSAWIRVVEGVHLKKLNISPYDGDTFHESPLFLRFYEVLLNYLNGHNVFILFIVIDIVTAFILAQVTCKQLDRTAENHKIVLGKNLKDSDDKKIVENLLIKPSSIKNSTEWVISIHALSPYSILPCVAQSTSVLNNFLISIIMLTATNGQRFISLFLLALNCLNTFYSLILLPPIILILEHSKKSKIASKNDNGHCSSAKGSIITSLFIFILCYMSLSIICLYLENWSFQFVNSTYVFMWTVSDLTPNIGLFWYFFAEMFDHFRTFFLWVFQINYFLYILPLTLRLRNNPYFLCVIALMNHSIFKPYPTVLDFSLYLCLLPQWSYLFEYMKSILIVSGTLVTTSILAPILWYLWIMLGTANSNFYFGITLAFNIGQILLMTDLIFAYIKHEFFMNNINLYSLCKQIQKNPKIELSYNL